MSRWPLICNRCGTEQYVGTLYAGMCPDCHMDATRQKLTEATTNDSGQSALGDFA
jgi:NMD protein affecting ribosome stability and mRNA decay